MVDDEILRTVEGPDGTADVSRRTRLLGKWFYCVRHRESGKYALFDTLDEAVRRAYHLCGLTEARYRRDTKLKSPW